jgi:hypothetical protein
MTGNAHDGPLARKEKDPWEKAQVVGTFLIGIAGVSFTFCFNTQQERNRESRDAIQVLTQREQSEMQFRSTMFDAMLKQLLTPTTDSLQQQIQTLQIFQQNFHDTFNGRAFFDLLARQVEKKRPKAVQDSLMDDLNRVGQRTSAFEESIVESNVGGRFPSFWVKPKQSMSVRLLVQRAHEPLLHRLYHWFAAAEEGAQKVGDVIERECKTADPVDHAAADHVHTVCLRLDSLRPSSAYVTLRMHEEEQEDSTAFGVSYFDTPFTDNTILPDGHRLALILKRLTADSAKFKMIEFPAGYILTGYRPSLGQVQQMLNR